VVGQKHHRLPVFGVILGSDGALGRCGLGVRLFGGVLEGVDLPATGSLAPGRLFPSGGQVSSKWTPGLRFWQST
jgi:hypothetical protein